MAEHDPNSLFYLPLEKKAFRNSAQLWKNNFPVCDLSSKFRSKQLRKLKHILGAILCIEITEY